MELNVEYIFMLCVLYINDIRDNLMNNHMDIPWHEYTKADSKVNKASAFSSLGKIVGILITSFLVLWANRYKKSSFNTPFVSVLMACLLRLKVLYLHHSNM